MKETIMERIDLPLSQFSQAQKVDLMESLWDDLSEDENLLESPAWHEAVLKERQKAFTDGNATVSDWEDTKERIKRNVLCK